MVRKRSKPVSFDAMVKFFMQNYNIPTKKDIDMLSARLETLERLLQSLLAAHSRGRRRKEGNRGLSASEAVTASEMVLDLVRSHPDGIGFPDIQAGTGFGEKKLRNIIFRLHKLGRIERQSRGIYTAVPGSNDNTIS